MDGPNRFALCLGMAAQIVSKYRAKAPAGFDVFNAAGDPIRLGALATNGIFLMTSETGIIINSYQRNIDSDKLDFYDGSQGRTTGVVYHDFKAAYTIKGAVNGSTGIMAGSIGVALSITNTSTGNGVASGGIYVDKFELNHSPKNLREVTVNMTQRDGVS